LAVARESWADTRQLVKDGRPIQPLPGLTVTLVLTQPPNPLRAPGYEHPATCGPSCTPPSPVPSVLVGHSYFVGRHLTPTARHRRTPQVKVPRHGDALPRPPQGQPLAHPARHLPRSCGRCPSEHLKCVPTPWRPSPRRRRLHQQSVYPHLLANGPFFPPRRPMCSPPPSGPIKATIRRLTPQQERCPGVEEPSRRWAVVGKPSDPHAHPAWLASWPMANHAGSRPHISPMVDRGRTCP